MDGERGQLQRTPIPYEQVLTFTKKSAHQCVQTKNMMKTTAGRVGLIYISSEIPTRFNIWVSITILWPSHVLSIYIPIASIHINQWVGGSRLYPPPSLYTIIKNEPYSLGSWTYLSERSSSLIFVMFLSCCLASMSRALSSVFWARTSSWLSRMFSSFASSSLCDRPVHFSSSFFFSSYQHESCINTGTGRSMMATQFVN